MIKCEKCGFECASQGLMNNHKEREELNISETEQKRLIRKWGNKWREHIKDDNK